MGKDSFEKQHETTKFKKVKELKSTKKKFSQVWRGIDNQEFYAFMMENLRNNKKNTN